MFGFLKKKLKDAVSKFTKKVEQEVEEKVIEKAVEKTPSSKTDVVEKKEKKPEIKKEEVKEEKKGFLDKIKKAISIPKEEVPVEEKEDIPKKTIFTKITDVVTKKTLSQEKFEELFFDLEVAMLENNVAVEVIEKIKEDMKQNLLSEKVARTKTEAVVLESLKNSIEELFKTEKIDVFKAAKKKKPYVICFVGVNGSGKTTNLAKLASKLKEKKLGVVIAACDTFRAAAIQQLQEHADKLGIKMIKHDYGADAAAVAYDAIEHAKAKDMDVVLIDTAGRSHANVNLMEELEKVVRVASPDLKIFVGDSLTGNDAVEQAKTFNEKVGIDGIILSKVDVDEKGGAAVSISYVTQKPIMFIGTGQTYADLEDFNKEKVLGALGL
ncbi:signal recognition particle-docking protein FtsY [Candidatus Woesearchaeota archaeon]|nr:signal recognition particle-docking protein FtsY [Candidatus Woesearchaeota archaeon]